MEKEYQQKVKGQRCLKNTMLHKLVWLQVTVPYVIFLYICKNKVFEVDQFGYKVCVNIR